jgi:hypothetical protein
VWKKIIKIYLDFDKKYLICPEEFLAIYKLLKNALIQNIANIIKKLRNSYTSWKIIISSRNKTTLTSKYLI